MKKVLSIIICLALIIAPSTNSFVAKADAIEYAIFPGNILKVTQGAYGEYNSYSHNGQGGFYQNAFDLSGNANYFAPFSGTITKIKTSYNAVVLQSDSKVYWANGDYDYMSVTFVHDNDISNLYVGKHINQGEIFYQPGVKDPGGYTKGTHLHICVNKGLTDDGIRIFSGDVRPNDAFFLSPNVSITQNGNYTWRTYDSNPISYTDIGHSNYLIKNASTGGYLNVDGGVDAQATNISLQSFNGTIDNSFTMEIAPESNGYRIRPHSCASRVVNVYAETVVSGKNVCIYDNTGHNSQRWNFEKVSGGFVIRNSQNSSCVLDVQSNSNVYVNTYSGAGTQIWKIENFIEYRDNGGSGSPATQFKEYDATSQISTTKPTRQGYTFLGWSNDPNATTPMYESGADYTANANIVLYAVWKEVEGNFTYTISDGEVTITGVNNSISGDVIIPSTIEGYPVTYIGESAFEHCSSMTSITIPSSVTSIQNWAFFGCTSLEKVKISDISAWCDIHFNDNFYYSNPLFYAKNLYLNGELVTDLVIPDGVTRIRDCAFNGCTSLTSVTIPSSLTSIDDNAFDNCSNLTDFCVEKDNTEYSDIDGVLFNKDQTTLINYPIGKKSTSYTVPNGVTSIADRAFIYCDFLENINISDSVISIGDMAFYYSSLESVTIGDSVTSIEDSAFAYCFSLTKVFYRGGSEDKTKITIGSNNSCLTDATWYYNSCIGSAEHSCATDIYCEICGDIVCVSGDLNGDGDVTTTDLATMKLFLAGVGELSDTGKLGADLNGDGEVNTTDLASLKLKLAGIE